MVEKIKAFNNPLTIIAIFAALAEVAGTVALGLVDKPPQQTFVLFVMGFPTLLVALFFVTLNFNPKVLYAPSDFRDEENFLSTLIGTQRVSMSLDEVTRQLKESKNQILTQAVEQITAAGGAERSKLETILGLQLRRIEARIESVRQTVQEVASDAIVTPHPQSRFQVRILQLLEAQHRAMSAAEIASCLDNADLDVTLRALARLNERSLVMKLSNIGQEDHYLIGTLSVRNRKTATSVRWEAKDISIK
jgi:hypothetical protein